MATTDPAPEWDWYSSRDLQVGSTHVHSGPYDDTVDEEREEVRERDRKRIKPGFDVNSKPPKKRRRRRK